MISSTRRTLAALLGVAAVLLVSWMASWSSLAALLGHDADARLEHWQGTLAPWAWSFEREDAIVWPGSSGFEAIARKDGVLHGRLPGGNADLSLALDGERLDLSLIHGARLSLRSNGPMHTHLIATSEAGSVEVGVRDVSGSADAYEIDIPASTITSAHALRLHLDGQPGVEVELRGLDLERHRDALPQRCEVVDETPTCSARIPILQTPDFLIPESALLWRDRMLQERPAAIIYPNESLTPSAPLAMGIHRAFRGVAGWIAVGLPLLALGLAYAGQSTHRSRPALELGCMLGPWLLLQWAGVEAGTFALDPRAYLAYWVALFALVVMRDPTPDWQFMGSARAWRATGQFALGAALIVAGAGLANALDADGFVPREIETDMRWRYPLWALVQQWILMRAFAPRMRRLFKSDGAAALATGALFGLLHLPNLTLMLATFAAGTCWAWLGYRHRALLPLVVSHVVLGLSLFALAPPWLLRSAEIGARFLMPP